jgi:hypothetical protein
MFAIGAAMFFAAPAFAQAPVHSPRDPATPNDRVAQPADRAGTPGAIMHNNQTGEKIGVATSFPVKSKLTGLSVRNSAGEKLGTVEDIVINLQDGKAQYLALSFGGVLGIGSKYFAVPFNEVRFNHGKEEMYFVLDVPKEKLQAAPGFEKNDWPDFADPKWRTEIDSYYRSNAPGTASRPVAPSQR